MLAPDPVLELSPTYTDSGVQGSLQRVKDFLNYAISQGWRSEAIFLFGFSQGATVALEAALSFPTKLGGVVSICGLPLRKSFEAKIAFELPMLFTLGDRDTKVSATLAFPIVRYCIHRSLIHPTDSEDKGAVYRAERNSRTM